MKPIFSNARFRSHLDVKPQGSVTLGFLDATITVGEVAIDVSDVVVRLTQEGQPSLAAPRRAYQNRDGDARSRASFRFDERTYRWLVASTFALPAVARQVELAVRELAERTRIAHGATASTQQDIPF